VTPQLKARIDRVCDGIIQNHLDLLLVLLADRGVDVSAQRDRADTLVRALLSYELASTLLDGGRRIPLDLDTSANPPLIRFNADLLGGQSDDELRQLIARPVADLLGLPTLDVGMALLGDDENQLRNLYHSAVRNSGALVTPANSVPAVVERRVMLFAIRLSRLLKALAQARIKLPSPRAFAQELLAMDRWPEWDDVADMEFTSAARELVEDAALLSDAIPPTELTLEICWDSLNLSPRSFLRHAGRALRSRNVPVGGGMLRALAELVTDDLDDLEDVSTWPNLSEISDAWDTLLDLEDEALLKHQVGEATRQRLSPLRAPVETTGLREPRDLPWDYPLACWSVREANALRDLISGFIQSHRADTLQEDTGDLVIADVSGAELPLDVSEEPGAVQMEMVGQTITLPEGYAQLNARAYEATIARLVEQFESLDSASQTSVLQRLRGGYDGFFPGSKHVWTRRLQGWKNDAPADALRRLATAARDVLGCPVFLNPFLDPVDTQINFMPTFCFVVALTAQMESVPFHVPVRSVLLTAATGQPPLRVRMVEVPEVSDASCTWCGDRELMMRTLEGQPVKVTLASVDGDMLRLVARD
jgi:hypothetical protein